VATGLIAVAAITGGLLARFAPSVGVLYGLSDLGPVVNAGLPAARVTALVAAAATVGNLLLAAVLCPGDPYGTVSPRGYAGLRMARACATVQAVACTAVAVLLAAENAAIPPARLLSRLTALFSSINSVEAASGWTVTAVIAAVVALGAGWALSWRSAVGLLILAVVGLLPVTLTTATNAEQSHDWAGDALSLHVVSAVVWLGSALAVVLQLTREHSVTAATRAMLRRHSVIATWSLLLVAGYGLAAAALAIDPADVPRSGYGLLLLASVVLLAGLAVVGWWARRVPPGRPGHMAALWLAAVELMLLAVGTAVGTALTRLFPPAQAGYQPSRLVYLLGYELPPHLTVADLVLRWRLDLIFGPIAVVGAVAYLLGVRRLRRDGRAWPGARTACWLGGCAVLLVTTSSGLASYGHAVFSVHMVDHMLLATLVPVLLVLGHGVSLALEVTHAGLRTRLLSLLDAPAVRFARHPAVAWTAVAVTLFGLYPTGLFGSIVVEHWAHFGMDMAFLGTGLALFWPVLGYSGSERGLPAIGRIVMVFAVMALHASFSAWLLSRATPLAAPFYGALQLPFFTDLLADQRRGAVLGWVLGEVAIMITVLVLVVRWARADRAESGGAATSWPDPRLAGDDVTYPALDRQ
jgi:putative copper resistance protein D